MKKIKEWFNRNIWVIAILLIMFGFVYTSYLNQENLKDDCTIKCEEIGYKYFYSEEGNVFKHNICKCINNDKIGDIL